MARTSSKATTTTKKIKSKVPKSQKTQDEHDAGKYRKMDQREHVLKRPDTYAGSIEHNEANVPVFISKNEETGKPDTIRRMKINYVPAFYKVYDEIIVNAIDQHTRMEDEYNNTKSKAARAKVDRVTRIYINIDQTNGTIEVINNGRGIDVVFMEEHNKWPPGLIFGELLTGENYDDNQQKTTGGKNGIGAKLANIYSTDFLVETVDSKRKRRYEQHFHDNMAVSDEPTIEENYTGDAFTRIKFHPDYTYFDMTGLDDQVFSLFKKRAWDTAAWCGSGVKVYFNGEHITVNTFHKYATMYIGDAKDYAHEVCNSRWEIMATYNNNDTFEQYSFVNGINTIRGGRHVDYIVDQICDKMILEVKKRNKELDIKKPYIKNQLMVFVKSTIVNPKFDGQTKETLTTTLKNMGSTCQVSDRFVKELAETGIIDRIIEQAQYKERKILNDTDGRKSTSVRGIDKYTPANKAGGREAHKCTLILTEGDSAKSLVVSGLKAADRDYYGIFPLKGKPLNVRDARIDQIANNIEFEKVKKIIGLESNNTYDKEYKVWPLNYGRLQIFADQDLDGYHIKALVMNYFATFHPGLLKKGFIISMLTPIVKVTKGKKIISFYSEHEYDEWKVANKNGKGWSTKYYKGLGTSTAKEAKEYFAAPKIVHYDWTGEDSAEAIDLAFRKERANNRKTWMNNYNEDSLPTDPNNKHITYEDYINKDLIMFSLATVRRAIPSVVDGLKPSQRKVLFGCFKRNLVKEIKVAQLAGYVSEHSGYHHGEMSLMGAIIGMAQNYIGSNNVNLLVPQGQFGTRIQGGNDHASPRYIFTYLSQITKMLFSDLDKPLLNYLEDDGDSVEPEYYVPILPTLLINGCNGIATGWSTSVPCYNPIDIGKLMECKLTNKPYPEIMPYYQGFKGTINKVKEGQYISKGCYERLNASTIIITELPVGTWTEKYIEFLNSLLPESTITKIGKKKGRRSAKKTVKGKGKGGARAAKAAEKAAAKKKADKSLINNMKDNSTETDIKITVRFKSPLTLMRMQKQEPDKNGVDAVEKYFKLTSNINTTNMVLIGPDGRVKKYNSPYEIMDDFFDIRMHYYIKRKENLIEHLQKQLVLINYKVKYIREVLNDTIDLRRKKKAVVDKLLKDKGYPVLSNNLDAEPEKYSYDYLVGMRQDAVTQEKIDELEKQAREKQSEFDELNNKPERRLWVEDLKVFFSKYKKDYNIASSKAKRKSAKTTKSMKKKTGGGCK
jgi:DNA topoisomerase-2